MVRNGEAMLRITVEIDAPFGADPQGVKEKLAMDLERYGDVRVVRVEEYAARLTPGEQMALNGWDPQRR